MRTFQIDDVGLQKLIAPAIRKVLVDAGFKRGAVTEASGDPNCAFFFPVNLDLSGQLTVERGEDGLWTFTQEDDPLLADRTAASLRAHAEAIEIREQARCR